MEKELCNQPGSRIKQVQGRELNIEGQGKEPSETNRRKMGPWSQE